MSDQPPLVRQWTLLRTLCGLQPPLSGEVTIAGTSVAELKPRERARLIGVVLTDRVDAGMLTAFSLVSLGRHPYTGWTGNLSEEDVAAVSQALERVGAGSLSRRVVSELSDGERQKVRDADRTFI